MTSRGGGDRTLRITILGDTKDAEKAVRELEISLGGIEKGGAKAQMGIGMFAAGAVAAGAAAGAAAIAIGRDLFNAYAESERASVKLGAVLKASGNVWNTTKEDILAYSTELQHATGISDETITNVQTLFLTFREVGPESFKRATEAALDMSAVFGQDASSSAVQLGKALQDPIAGVTALRRVGVQLSDQQEEQIKKFAEANDIVGAQNIILTELEKQVGGTARALGETAAGKVDRFNQSMGDMQERLGEAVYRGFEPLLDAAVEWAESDSAIKFTDNLAAAMYGLSTAMKEAAAMGRDINAIVKELTGWAIPEWLLVMGSAVTLPVRQGAGAIRDALGAARNAIVGPNYTADTTPPLGGWRMVNEELLAQHAADIQAGERPRTTFGGGSNSRTGGGSAKEDPIVTAWKSIHAELQREQQRALMTGGQAQLAEVRYAQEEIVRATREMAERAHEAIGIDMADALKVAFDTVRDQAKESAKALEDYAEATKAAVEAEKALAEERRREAFRLTQQLWANAGGGMSAATAGGLAALAEAASRGVTGSVDANGVFTPNMPAPSVYPGAATVNVQLSSDLAIAGEP